MFQKKQYFLGTYEKIEDAAEARKRAEEALFDAVLEHYRKWEQRARTDPAWAEENPVRIIVHQENGKLQVTQLPYL